MAYFLTINHHGGVIVPGTLSIDFVHRGGERRFVVIAGVHDSHYFPEELIYFEIGSFPYLGLAEYWCAFINSGGHAKFDIEMAMPSKEITMRLNAPQGVSELYSMALS